MMGELDQAGATASDKLARFRGPIPSLVHRRAEPEHFDDLAQSEVELARLYRELDRLNRLFKFARPFQLFLPQLLGRERCRSLDILDIGAGTGALGRELTAWAKRRGWTWRVAIIDRNRYALELGRPQISSTSAAIAGSATALPFASESFDCVIASQMTHHLASDTEVIEHFREAWRVTRDGLLIADLYRHPAVYVMVWWTALLAGCSARIRADGAASVARAFRVPEWERMARKAGIDAARVSIYFKARVLLQARKGVSPFSPA